MTEGRQSRRHPLGSLAPRRRTTASAGGRPLRSRRRPGRAAQRGPRPPGRRRRDAGAPRGGAGERAAGRREGPGGGHAALPVLHLRFAGGGRAQRVSGSAHGGRRQARRDRHGRAGRRGRATRSASTARRSTFALTTAPDALVGLDLRVDPPGAPVAWKLFLDDAPWPDAGDLRGPVRAARRGRPRRASPATTRGPRSTRRRSRSSTRRATWASSSRATARGTRRGRRRRRAAARRGAGDAAGPAAVGVRARQPLNVDSSLRLT